MYVCTQVVRSVRVAGIRAVYWSPSTWPAPAPLPPLQESGVLNNGACTMQPSEAEVVDVLQLQSGMSNQTSVLPDVPGECVLNTATVDIVRRAGGVRGCEV